MAGTNDSNEEEGGSRWSDLQGFIHASLLLQLLEAGVVLTKWVGGARARVPLQGQFTLLVESATTKLAKVHNDQEN